MPDVLESILGKKVSGVRVVPLLVKIVALFTIVLLVSNFSTNYINAMFHRLELVRQLQQLLIKDMEDLHIFANGQADFVAFNNDLDAAVTNIQNRAVRSFSGEQSIALGVRPNGTLLFQAGGPMGEETDIDAFPDPAALETMVTQRVTEGVDDASLYFFIDGNEYFSVYKWNDQWEAFILLGEELDEFYAPAQTIFFQVSWIIVAMTLISVLIGVFLLRHILRYVKVITESIMGMQAKQSIDLLNMEGAPNDDVTYLGIAFNSLASTIDNLMTIFKKFVARDVAARAYKEREIRLEGRRRELTILFTDIKSFTYMTETLGTDIIKLLNLHYDKAIHHIHEHNGDIGSIIGDALLAIFGVMEDDSSSYNKSLASIQAAYLIQDVAADLRQEMNKRRETILRQRGSMTDAEDRIYKAVLIEVGVGIDGGEVFYGNIGSYERMVNTVIGDNVNAASRLEGLTRVYKVPVICSGFVRDEAEAESDDYYFMELDQVQVKGKTYGRQVYWPIQKKLIDQNFKRDIDTYSEALREYYAGNWPEATGLFEKCTLPMSDMFVGRIKGKTSPQNWKGIWTMTEK